MKTRRLHTLDRFLKIPGDDAPLEDNLESLAEIVEGEIIRIGESRILKVTDDCELFPYSSVKDISDHLQSDLYQRWHFVTGGDETSYDPSRFLFLDTETTGLSGGAGMMIFLCGFGFFVGTTFRVIQYFLPDYPHEPLLLQLASEHFHDDTILVTYNGKAFDWPMLVQRLTINRMDIPAYCDHLDVLHPARSLFRRLGDDCSLTTLEKSVLSFDRGEDIPGYLIPGKYFDYLYDRQPGAIPEVIRHNRLDIISLALLTRHIPEYLLRPEKITNSPLLEGVIHHLFRNHRYEMLLTYVGQVTPGHFEDSSPVAKLEYSLALKGLGRLAEAGEVWRAVVESETGPQVARHLLELAKYQEHHQKDPETALETVDLLLGIESRLRARQELLHRQQRLMAKSGRFTSKNL